MVTMNGTAQSIEITPASHPFIWSLLQGETPPNPFPELPANCLEQVPYPTETFEITAESDPELWAILQRPEERQLLDQAIDIVQINRLAVASQPETTAEQLQRLQEQVTKLKLKTACSIHGLGDRNIARLREEIEAQESYTDECIARLDRRIDELRSELDRAELEIIDLKYSGPPPELGEPDEPQPDRTYRKTSPVAAVGGIGLLLICFSAVSFAIAGFSSSASQKDYHAGLAGMLACAGLGTIAAAVATNWED